MHMPWETLSTHKSSKKTKTLIKTFKHVISLIWYNMTTLDLSNPKEAVPGLGQSGTMLFIHKKQIICETSMPNQ